MAEREFFGNLEDVTQTGQFFVDLTRRLGERPLKPDEDVVQLAHTLGVAIPPGLAGAQMTPDAGATIRASGRARISPVRHTLVLHYPPVPPTPGSSELKVHKCFNVCRSVGPVKTCVTICVTLDVGLTHVGGNITATVTVTF